MSENAGAIEFDAKINLDQLRSDGKEAEQIAKKTADNVGGNVEEGLKTAAKGLAVAGVGLTAFAKSATDFTVDYVKDSKKLSREIGTSVEEASRLVSAFGRMGVSSEQASTAFGIFSKNISKATEQTEDQRIKSEDLKIQMEKTRREISLTNDEIKKNGDKTGDLGLKVKDLTNKLESQTNELEKSANAFDQLGLSTTNADGTAKDFNTVLFEVADKFKGMPDGIEKTRLSMEFFGRSGKDMIPILNQGADGIKNLEAEADKLGLTLTTDTIGKINDLIKSQKDLKQQTDALKIAVGTATAPVLTAFNEKVNSVVSALLNAPGPVREATTAILAFGGPVAGATSALVGFLANASSIAGKTKEMTAALGAASGAFAIVAAGGISTFNTASGIAKSNIDKVRQALVDQGFDMTKLGNDYGTARFNLELLNQSTNLYKTAQDNLATSTDNLSRAFLDQESAGLAVQEAQKALDQTIRTYGAGSLEAQRATLNLKYAQDANAKAAEGAEKAMTDNVNAQVELAKKDDLLNSTKALNGQLDRQGGLFSNIFGLLNNLPGKLESVGGKVNTFLKNLSAKAGGHPTYAGGTDYHPGGLAVVGEEGPELVNLPRGTSVTPANQTKRMLGGATSVGSANMSSQVGSSVGMSAPVINVILKEGILADSTMTLRNAGKKIAQGMNDELRAKGASKSQLIGGGLL